MDPFRPEPPSAPTPDPGKAAPNRRLDSWKEIAAYLRRDVATVRRWEKREGLPVHRHLHDKLGSVFADSREIDEWYQWRSQQLSSTQPRAVDADNENEQKEDEVQTPQTPVPPRLSAGSVRRAAVWAVVLAAVAVAGWIGAWLASSDPPATVRFLLATDEPINVTSLAVSPNGTEIALAGNVPGQPDMLWLRPLGSTTPVVLQRTENASLPFWSPAGTHLGFFADGKLKKIALSNGSVEVICPAPHGRGGTWSQDNVIVFSPGDGAPLSQVPASGGIASTLTTVVRGDAGHKWPEFLPDGRHVLYFVDTLDSDREGVYVTSLDAPRPRRVLAVGSNAIPTIDGRLLFIRGTRLLAQRFDTDRMQVTGDPLVVAEPVLTQRAMDRKGDFSVSRTGVLAYRNGAAAVQPMVWIDRKGNRVGTLGEPGLYAAPVLSPNEQRVAVVRFDPDTRKREAAIWTIDVASGAATRLTIDPQPSVSPIWSPDGAQIMFASMRGTRNDLVQKEAGGTATERVLYQQGGFPLLDAWSRDGRFIFYSVFNGATSYDTWALPLSGASKPFAVLRGKSGETQSQLSPNGQLLSFTSDVSGKPEVYVTRFPSRSATWQISSNGGGDARWRDDGKELTYIAVDRRLMAVDIGPAPSFTRGIPQPLFDTRIQDVWDDMRNHYDVAADGQRFLFTVPLDDARTKPFTILMPWDRGAR